MKKPRPLTARVADLERAVRRIDERVAHQGATIDHHDALNVANRRELFERLTTPEAAAKEPGR